jgi:hypothetical protein
MTLSAFEVIGTLPRRGRMPTAEEDAPDGTRVALISDVLWVGRYGAHPSMIGKTIELNNASLEVIGIMSRRVD